MIDVGFSAVVDGGTASLRAFASSDHLAARHLDACDIGDSAFVLIGRLHYRTEHLGALRPGLRTGEYEACRASDAALAAYLYRENGVTGLTRLLGDYVVAGLDRVRRRLVVLRDPTGAYPCFWRSAGASLRVATTVRALGEDPDPVQVDDGYLADYFAFPTDSLAELPAEKTAYRGVNRLLPGWCLEGDSATGRVLRRWSVDWAWPLPHYEVISLGEAGELVREHLRASVAERLSRSGRNASHLSGGFDSTAVALLANELLLPRGDALEAVTLVYGGDRVQVGEGEFVEAALSGRSGIHHHPCPADELVEFAHHERIPPVDEPSPMVADFARVDALLETAQQAGADTVLSGDGGDILFYRSPASMVAELLRRGRAKDALELARASGLRRSESTARILRRAAGLLLPLSARSPLGYARRPSRLRPRPLRGFEWLTRDFVDSKRLDQRAREWASQRDEGRSFGLGQVADLAGDWYHWNLAVPRGLTQPRPFFDVRLMGVAAQLPADLALVAAPMKPVLAEAMADVLPEKILNRASKAHFNYVLSGYARHRQWLLDLLHEAPPDDIVDRRGVEEAVERVALGAFDSVPAANRLAMVFGYLIWAADRERWRSRPLPYRSLAEAAGHPITHRLPAGGGA